MKKLFLIAVFFITSMLFAQDIKPITEKKEDISFKFYGFLDIYAIKSDSQMNFSELYFYPVKENVDSLVYSVRLTRFGTKIAFNNIEKFKLNANLEFDFSGNLPDSGAAESRSGIMLRHAFFDLNKTIDKFSFGTIIGSTWSIAAPVKVMPTLINPAVGWATGNIWQRMPQFQGYLNYKAIENFSVDLKLALSAPMSGASVYRNKMYSSDLDSTNLSGLPIFEGQLAFNYELNKAKMFLAFSGAYGQENYSKMLDEKVYKDGKDVDVKLMAVSLNITHPLFGINTKLYKGENIDLYGAQLGSNLVYTTIPFSSDDPTKVKKIIDSVETQGFFAELSVSPFGEKSLTVVGGYGFDDPNEDDYEGIDKFNLIYNKNIAFWFGIYQTVFDRLRFGFNYMNFQRKYSTTYNGNDTSLKGNSYFFDVKLDF